MPASPALRCSPGRELRSENHKRGRSLEGGILFKEKDDDLALFNEVQSKERDNFLLQSNDDFEDLFSTKLRYFSDHKLGISIPARGESSDLLNAEGEKNDYDWLLTPPDTPLFPSLDDEAAPVNHAQRGRPRSQPIAISRSSTMERSHRSSRGSASPNRLSPSPRSSHSTYQSRSRPSSAPHSSPPPSLRHSTPTRRPSPPPSKSPMPAPRSSTPTPRRLNTGSSSHVVPSKVRGNSPVKTGRGNSASPKIKAWQANIPGFSSEAPPNLRTSLADRPASYVRGSSPASRNGSKSGRQSMSPTASRSVSSSFSHDRDRFSSHSKGSVASSGDDDLDSLQSIPVSSLDYSVPKSISTFSNNRALSSSRKPMRTVTSSSAPKRSFDMAIRQMDQRKSPQNMFRPLLSSVPTSTFYASKSGATHRSVVSINSSVTTSSNASSEPGISGAHDIEDREQIQDDVTSEHIKTAYLDMHEEVFAFDKADSIDEKSGIYAPKQLPDGPRDEIDGSPRLDSPLVGNENPSQNNAVMEISATSELLEQKGNCPSMDCLEEIVLCSKCGRRFSASDLIVDEDLIICRECKGTEMSSVVSTSPKGTMKDENSVGVFSKISNGGSFDAFSPSAEAPESLDVTSTGEPGIFHGGNISSVEHNPYGDANRNLLPASNVAHNLGEEGKQVLIGQQMGDQQTVSSRTSNAKTDSLRLQNFSGYSSSKSDVSEGAGISLLLTSTSGKGPIVRSRTFTATSITCDDFSYMRDSATSTRSSYGHGSASASSSVDLGSTRQTDTRVQRQGSGRKSDFENYRCEMIAKHQRSGSSLSGTSTHAFQTSSMATSGHEESFEVSAVNLEKNTVDPTCIATQGHSLTSENREGDIISTDVESDNNWGTVSDLSSCTMNVHPGDASVPLVSNFEESDLNENGKVLTSNSLSAVNVEPSSMHIETRTEREDAMSSACIDGVDAPNYSSLDVISEMEIENDEVVSPDSVFDIGSQNSKSSIDDLQDPSATMSYSNIAVEESTNLDYAESIVEGSTVMLEGQGSHQARSLTLEEATDTILFCSSIVHNLAYEAANIAIEKENAAPLEGFHPVVTIVGKSNNDRRDSRARPVAKRNSKSQKARQRRLETDPKPAPPENTTNDDKIDSSTARIVGAPNKGDSMKPPKLESKCNCTIM